MTTITAYAISPPQPCAARCPCDLDRGRPGPARSANAVRPADAVLAYDDRCLLVDNREVRGVLD